MFWQNPIFHGFNTDVLFFVGGFIHRGVKFSSKNAYIIANYETYQPPQHFGAKTQVPFFSHQNQGDVERSSPPTSDAIS